MSFRTVLTTAAGLMLLFAACRREKGASSTPADRGASCENPPPLSADQLRLSEYIGFGGVSSRDQLRSRANEVWKDSRFRKDQVEAFKLLAAAGRRGCEPVLDGADFEAVQNNPAALAEVLEQDPAASLVLNGHCTLKGPDTTECPWIPPAAYNRLMIYVKMGLRQLLSGTGFHLNNVYDDETRGAVFMFEGMTGLKMTDGSAIDGPILGMLLLRLAHSPEDIREDVESLGDNLCRPTYKGGIGCEPATVIDLDDEARGKLIRAFQYLYPQTVSPNLRSSNVTAQFQAQEILHQRFGGRRFRSDTPLKIAAAVDERAAQESLNCLTCLSSGR